MNELTAHPTFVPTLKERTLAHLVRYNVDIERSLGGLPKALREQTEAFLSKNENMSGELGEEYLALKQVYLLLKEFPYLAPCDKVIVQQIIGHFRENFVTVSGKRSAKHIVQFSENSRELPSVQRGFLQAVNPEIIRTLAPFLKAMLERGTYSVEEIKNIKNVAYRLLNGGITAEQMSLLLNNMHLVRALLLLLPHHSREIIDLLAMNADNEADSVFFKEAIKDGLIRLRVSNDMEAGSFIKLVIALSDEELIKIFNEETIDYDYVSKDKESLKKKILSNLCSLHKNKALEFLLQERIIDANEQFANAPVLKAAIETNNLEACQLFHKYGADFSQCPPGSASFVFHAALRKYNQIATWLVESGAPANLDSEDAINLIKAGNIEFLKFLISSGKYDTHARDEDGNTLLHMAGQFKSPEFCEFLLANGVDARHRNDARATALIHALHVGENREVTPNESNRILHILKMLLSHDRDLVNIPVGDNDEIFPIAFAIQEKMLDAVRLLVEHGADLNRCVQGKDAIEYAREMRCEEIGEYLQQVVRDREDDASGIKRE